ncbi:transposase [Paractinoplanes durhamensis]|uniref:transposase n=1 Tax=Paractinoplanes durhamensis TaxID=113563 RepID=UPI0019434F3A|nr:transposase [Actinoplanes durhamensis]
MSKAWIVDDESWKLIEPTLPPWPTRAGPRPFPDRLCLQGILFVLHTGISWENLPQELGFGSGMTCRRRLQRWTKAGVFHQIHQTLLTRQNAAKQLRLSTGRAAH